MNIVFFEKHRRLLLFFFIPVLLLIMHWRIFTTPLVGVHVWRQTQTQQNIDNFVNEDFNILNPRLNNHGNENPVQRMEFPLMQWLFACFYKVFGNHLIISRILSFVIGLLSVWGMYALIRQLTTNVFVALGGAWCFAFSPLIYYYSLNPLPDNMALCLAIWGTVAALSYSQTGYLKTVAMAAALLMTATLCKLPFVVFSGVLFLIFLRGLKSDFRKSLVLACIVLLIYIPALAWYIAVIPGWEGNGVLTGIFANNENSSWNYLWGNFSSTLPELLLNYGACLFFILGFVLFFRKKGWKIPAVRLLLFPALLVVCYFIYELNMIANVHDYYLMPFLPFLFLLVSGGIQFLLSQQSKWFTGLVLLLICVLPFTAFLRIDSRWNVNEPGFNKDLLIHHNALVAAVPDTALCIAGNDLSQRIVFYNIRKRGWNFMNEEITADWVADKIRKGARYGYSDSEITKNDTNIRKLIRKEIGTYGSIQVFELKTAAEIK